MNRLAKQGSIITYRWQTQALIIDYIHDITYDWYVNDTPRFSEPETQNKKIVHLSDKSQPIRLVTSLAQACRIILVKG